MANEFDDFEFDVQKRICEDTLETLAQGPVLRGIQTAQGEQVQQLYNAEFDEAEARLLDNAVGYQLDTIGRIVGLFPRPLQDSGALTYFSPDVDDAGPDWGEVWVTNAPTAGQVPLNDPDYRRAIRAQIIKNHTKFGSAPENQYYGQFAFGVPISVKNVGLSDLEVIVPANAPPSLLRTLTGEVSDDTADHKYNLPVPTTSRIVRVSFRYPNAFAPDIDDGAPDIALMGVSYGINP